MKKKKPVSPTLRERDLTERLARAERDELAMREDYGRRDAALDGLIRAVLLFVASESSYPTSINSDRLLSAVHQASRTIHDRRKD